MLPAAVGICASDVPSLAAIVNRATQTLVNAGGESGFWGGWAKVLFKVSRCKPYITLGREYARAINLDYCRWPAPLNNEFAEFLEAGIGLQSFGKCQNWCGKVGGYERGVYPTHRDVDPVGQMLRVYLTDVRDVGRRILIGPAQDQNGNFIYSQDGNNSVNGFYMPLEQPFTTSSFQVSNISGISKDATYGDVLLYQVDAATGVQVLLSKYAPDEISPAYRRYYLNGLPCGCEPTTPQSGCIVPNPVLPEVAVTAMVKLEFIPVSRSTDFNIIGNIPALIAEAKSIRYSDMDAANAPVMAQTSHRQAIKLLQDEMRHYLGELSSSIAVNFAPFGTARLSRPLQAVRYG